MNDLFPEVHRVILLNLILCLEKTSILLFQEELS